MSGFVINLKKNRKVSILDLVPILRVRVKTTQKNCQKNGLMYLVPANNLKNKKKC